MVKPFSKPRQRQRTWIFATLHGIYDRILKRGFHGQATLTITVQDGTIQHYTHAVEEHHRPTAADAPLSSARRSTP